MPNKIGSLFLFLFISLSVFSQDRMILNDQKSIPATEVWKFTSDTYTYSGGVEVQIGNNGKEGALLVQLESSEPTFYIGGNVYLFLEDGNVITCTDKNVRSISGKMIQSYYVLTTTEINLLKKTKITDIRFRINGNETQFSSPTGFFTAHNKIRRFGLPDKTYDTVTEIKQVFN
ncbi:hypothetical protein FLAN108750_10185 [Flavobacterium antarcticum]|uniref:hypothetical protein n=1 Tax=Flavobacterium antarcticum TaxID=271155 RepID=UPI0003B62236|nr:hypothetical protein [Flavobacterium antarcticum]